MSTVVEFEKWLLSEHYVEKRRKVLKQIRTMGDANLTISFQHPELGWAHVSEYVRLKKKRVECVLHPMLLGERTIHDTLSSAVPRLATIKGRVSSDKTRIHSEPKIKRKNSK